MIRCKKSGLGIRFKFATAYSKMSNIQFIHYVS